jgi:hypothetical protein
MIEMDHFISGGVAFGYLMAGVFFLRFWRRTHDRLFVMFALAFWLLGIVRFAIVATSVTTGEVHEDHFLYWFRLIAYLLILAGILDKNLRK